jgi:hypothetical protein
VLWEFALWGLFGGFAVEGLDHYRALKAGGPAPWSRKGSLVHYLVASLMRVAIGGGLALAAAESDQVSTPLTAVAIGVAAPVLIERLLQLAPELDPETATTADLREPRVPGTVDRPEAVSEQ